MQLDMESKFSPNTNWQYIPSTDALATRCLISHRWLFKSSVLGLVIFVYFKKKTYSEFLPHSIFQTQIIHTEPYRLQIHVSSKSIGQLGWTAEKDRCNTSALCSSTFHRNSCLVHFLLTPKVVWFHVLKLCPFDTHKHTKKWKRFQLPQIVACDRFTETVERNNDIFLQAWVNTCHWYLSL